MKHLDVPVPQTLYASYLIPLAAPMTGAEVHRRITRAVGTRLTGPLKTLVLQWADQGRGVRPGAEAEGYGDSRAVRTAVRPGNGSCRRRRSGGACA